MMGQYYQKTINTNIILSKTARYSDRCDLVEDQRYLLDCESLLQQITKQRLWNKESGDTTRSLEFLPCFSMRKDITSLQDFMPNISISFTENLQIIFRVMCSVWNFQVRSESFSLLKDCVNFDVSKRRWQEQERKQIGGSSISVPIALCIFHKLIPRPRGIITS